VLDTWGVIFYTAMATRCKQVLPVRSNNTDSILGTLADGGWIQGSETKINLMGHHFGRRIRWEITGWKKEVGVKSEVVRPKIIGVIAAKISEKNPGYFNIFFVLGV
jgi:hypothetical protein